MQTSSISMSAVIRLCCLALVIPLFGEANLTSAGEPIKRTYQNRLTPLRNPKPLLSNYPEFVQPITDKDRFEAPALIVEEGADLSVRAWRFSYNARGIIEIPNRIRSDRTAVIVVHPWGIDDGQGWKTPTPNGVAFQCTPVKNQYCRKHVEQVVNPFVQNMRDRVAVVMYSLPGREDPIRKKLYRSFRTRTTAQTRKAGAKELAAKLGSFEYKGQPLPASIPVSGSTPVIDYFKQFPGLDAGAKYNNAGFWDLPIPVMSDLKVDPEDVVIYDAEGYELLKNFLKQQGIRHILLTGYNTDMCVCETTAGYKNLRNDFNVFLVGDATLATSPASPTPAVATTAAVSFASLNLLITQVSWVRPLKVSQTASKK